MTRSVLRVETSKAFLPLYYDETFSFILPFYFYRFPLAEEQRDRLPYDAVQSMFWQAIFTAKFNDSLELALITESRHNGTEDTQFDLVGSDIAEFVLLSWDISPQWTFAPAARVKVAWDENNDREIEVLPAGHVIYRPSRRLSLMTGLPSLFALEWAAPGGVDFATHVMLGEGNNIDVMSALRVRVSEGLAVTGRFLRDGYEDISVPSFEFSDADQNDFVIDEIAQYRNRAQLEFELYPSENTIVQLKGGYGFDEGVRLSGGGEELAEVAGEDGLYFGLTFISHFNLDRAQARD